MKKRLQPSKRPTSPRLSQSSKSSQAAEPAKAANRMSRSPQPESKPRSSAQRRQPPTRGRQNLKSKKKWPREDKRGVSGAKLAEFPLIGVGASAGGLEALEELLKDMPEDVGMAFVVVTHQHPGHASLLPSLLAKASKLPVKEATNGMKVLPNHVYVAPPGGTLAILNGVLHRMEPDKKEAPWLPIDCFFRSLAEDQKERAVCVILSGTATDGTLGLRVIKGESGMAMVQQVQSAKYAGMPSSAISTGLVDIVATPAEMPRHLMDFAHRPHAIMESGEHLEKALEQPLQKVFLLLRSRTGNDFSAYKPSTIQRRIERRMGLNRIKGLPQYVRYLQENPTELDILFKELLISVTNFFRDAEAFETLGRKVLPHLLRSRPENYTFRAWVPGCATGEEVYTLAMLLRECADALKRHFDAQIFGTDLDKHAIEVAREGSYPDGVGADVLPKRLQQYFNRDDNAYRVRKEVREMAVFAVQNLLKDPPFTKLDLISCRNLLIYLNAEAQRQLLRLFHYALRPGGVLMLGPSETIGGATELFEVVDKKWKIFRRKETAVTTFPLLDRSGGAANEAGGPESIAIVTKIINA